MPQVSRPESDAFRPVQGGIGDSWINELGETAFPIFESINTFLPNDLTYGECDQFGNDLPEDSVVYVAKLSVVPSPEMASQGLTIRVRLAKDAESGERINATVELREEWNNEVTDLGILIASAVFEDVSAEFTEYSFVATPAQAGNILDFDALYLRMFFTTNPPI